MYSVRPLFTIPEQIAGQIKESVLHGDLHLGDRLPSEKELAEIFGASRSTVRDALHLLRNEYIIETRTGKNGGHFVPQKAAPQMIKNLNDYAFSSFKYCSISFEHFFEFRVLVEAPMAGLAAKHRSNEDLNSLKNVLATLNGLCLSSHSSYSFFQEAISFQCILAKASKNPLMTKLIDYLCQLSEVLTFQFLLSPHQERMLYEALLSIYFPVEKHDFLNAEKRMIDYLELLQGMEGMKHIYFFGTGNC